MGWIHYDGTFLCVGRWELLLHDAGWTLCRDWIVRLDGRWPTYATLKRLPLCPRQGPDNGESK